MKRITLLLVFSFLVLTIYGQSDTTKQLDALFSQWNNATPGGSIIVSRNDVVIYHKAFGLADLEHNIPNTTETIFEGGSVSKQFTAASILLLASEGKLSVEDDVRKYIPELPFYGTTILIRHLLNHTSGLKDWGAIGALSGWPRTTRVYSQELALDIISKQKTLNFRPGSEYSYSNSNYSLLVSIVERVSGQSLADFTRTRFFEPLGMTHTRWRNNFREIVPDRAIAYSKAENGYQQLMPFENIYGHGGILTTTGDLMKWNALLRTHAIGGDKVAAGRIKKGILTNGKEITYASGLMVDRVNGVEQISHSGATAGYRAWLAYYPKSRLSVAVLSNDGSFGPATAGSRIAEIFFGIPVKRNSPSASVKLSDADLKRFSGLYKSVRNFDVLNIEYKDNKLWSDGREFIAIHQDTLYLDGLKLSLAGREKLMALRGQDTSSYKRVMLPEVDKKRLSGFAGNYYSAEAEATFTIEVKENEVWVRLKPAISFRLIPSFRDGFVTEENELIEFKRDKRGNIIGFEVSMSRAERVPFVRIK